MAKKKHSKKVRSPLSERFEFVGEAVQAPGDAKVLRAPVIAVYDRVAQIDRGLRVWRKTRTAIDADLRELWLHEMRQVRRLMSSAGASEVIVDLIELVEDDEEFGIVVEDAGQSLALMRSRAGQNHWLRNLRGGRARALLWGNVRRLARALGLVHGQGLIHGTLSANAIMTHGALDPDFRLTGFEWSLWFAAPANVPTHMDLPAAALFRQQAYSFSADWRALGELVAELIGVRLSPTGEVKAARAGAEVELSAIEAMLLRRLVYPGAAEALDGPSVTRSIDDIVADIARAGAVRTGRFIILIPDSCGLAKAAAQATGNAIDSDERRLQLEWAVADSAAGATLFVQPKTSVAPERLTLVTDTMSYVLKAFTEQSGEASWDIAFCESASLREIEVVRGRRGVPHELLQPITFLPTHREARDLRATLGAAVLDWSVFLGQAPSDPAADGRRDVRRALTLVQALEAFTKAMEILPVEAVEVDRDGGRRIVTLRAREDARDAVAVPIGLAPTDAALRRLFDDDGRQGDGSWLIGVSNRLDGGRSANVAATFLDVIDAQGLTSYRFELDDNLPTGTPLFLRSKQEQGTGAAIRRRLRNIAAIADQPAVADMLEDPWLIRRTSREALLEDESFRELDAPKQDAMRRLWSTLPLFAVVGPPGVGKTRLAREVVVRRFKDEPSSRLLLTAQGHHALDHLQEEVTGALASIGRSDALVVRTTTERKPADPDSARDDEEPEYDATRAKVTEMLETLSGSALSATFPPPVRARLAAHARSAAVDDRDPEMRRSYQASANLLLDAANVVVSTTNSAAIGRMVAERANFDLVIVEEAAKATGPELAGALGLSGRQLLIGDHRQLPPFDADRMGKILSNDDLARKVIEGAPDVVGSFFAEGELADLQAVVDDGPAFERLKGLATRMVQPFRAIVTGDEQRSVAGLPSRRLSAVLTEQRRMNPAIAEIVSHAFYDGKLTTSAGTASSSPVECMAPLPTSPVVVVDFEHVSRTGKSAQAEFRVRGFHNPREVLAVMDVLRLIRAFPGDPPPTVAVLSPYREQVSRIREAFEAARREGRLPDFEGLHPVRSAVGYFGTVDSFQGSEADVVVVSLVRNNSRTGRSGLGFLSDPRRMNALLSRAKSKLVLVGSLRFLREAVRGVDPGGEKDDLRFLTTALDVVQRLAQQRGEDGTALAAVIRPESLRVGA